MRSGCPGDVLCPLYVICWGDGTPALCVITLCSVTELRPQLTWGDFEEANPTYALSLQGAWAIENFSAASCFLSPLKKEQIIHSINKIFFSVLLVIEWSFY